MKNIFELNKLLIPRKKRITGVITRFNSCVKRIVDLRFVLFREKWNFSWKYRDKILDGRKECLYVSRCSIIARANNLFYLDLYEISIIMDIVISANYTFFFQFLQCNLLIRRCYFPSIRETLEFLNFRIIAYL